MALKDILSKLSSRKYVGAFLKRVMKEYEAFKETSDITYDSRHVAYTITNDESDTIRFDFILYATGWKVDIETDKYVSPEFGCFENVHESFTIGTKLLKFINELKYPQTKSVRQVNEQPFEEVLEKLRTFTKELILDNIHCTDGVFQDIDAKKINEAYLSFKHDKIQINLVNLFMLFKKIDNEVNCNQFIKELALYVIAKHIIDSKNETFNESEPQPFTIEAQSNPICYAHTLQFYGGKCKYLHGHNGILTILANLKQDTIAKRPMFLSYGFLKTFLKYMDTKLDHKTFWALNKTDLMKLTNEGYRIETPKQIIIFKSLEGVTLFPFLVNSVSYSTSEVTLYNFVVPQFLIFLVRFMINDSGPDNNVMAINDFSEPIKYSFKWNETDSTVCGVTIDC